MEAPPAVRLRRWMLGTPVPEEPKVSRRTPASPVTQAAPAAAAAVATAAAAAPPAVSQPVSEKEALRLRILELERTKAALEGRLGSVMDKLSGGGGGAAVAPPTAPAVVSSTVAASNASALDAAAMTDDDAAAPAKPKAKEVPPAMWLSNWLLGK